MTPSFRGSITNRLAWRRKSVAKPGNALDQRVVVKRNCYFIGVALSEYDQFALRPVNSLLRCVRHTNIFRNYFTGRARNREQKEKNASWHSHMLPDYNIPLLNPEY